MKVLFTSVSAHGHLLPMVPLMQATLDADHDVAVMVSAGLADTVRTELPAGVVFLPAGPMPFELATEAAQRTGGDVMQPTVEGIGETFGGVLLDLSLEAGLPAARDWGAQAVVADMYSTLGALLGAALEIPWYRFSLSVPLPTDWEKAIHAARDRRAADHGLVLQPPTATFDIWPAELAGGVREPSSAGPTIRIQTRPHSAPGARSAGARGKSGRRPKVLVTLGTTFSDADLLQQFVDVVSSHVDVVATRGMLLGVPLENTTEGSRHDADTVGEGEPRVTWVDFTPIDTLLDGVSAVVTVGGAGTVLAALSRGLPLVLWPQGADQPRIAEAVAAAGAGMVVTGPEEASAAIRTVMDDAEYRERARGVAAGIAAAEPLERAVA